MSKNEELNDQLYQKLSEAQDSYRNWLLSQTLEEILNHCYEYFTRQNVLVIMEDADLSDEQAAALLQAKDALGDICYDFAKADTNYMDVLRDTIENRADQEIQKEAERREAIRKLPVYLYPGDYAYEHDELETYRASYKANIACRDAIDAAIREHYHDNSLDVKAAVAQVVDVFGYDRMLHVCANTIRQKEWDGRISQDNIQWARTLPIYEDKGSFGHDRRAEYIVDKSHPGLFNMFVKAARHEYLLSLPLTKDDIKAEALNILSQLQNAREPNSPSGTHYMARVSPVFLSRAKDKERDRMMGMLPFDSLTLSTLEGRKGIFAMISKDEDRFQKLRLRKPSVLKRLHDAQEQVKPASAPKRSRDMER